MRLRLAHSGLVLTRLSDDSVAQLAEKVITQGAKGREEVLAGQSWVLTGQPDRSVSIAPAECPTQCLEIAYGECATANGVPARVFDNAGTTNQRWSFVPAGTTYFLIALHNVGTPRCLEVWGGARATEPGLHLSQWELVGSDNQRWAVLQGPDPHESHRVATLLSRAGSLVAGVLGLSLLIAGSSAPFAPSWSRPADALLGAVLLTIAVAAAASWRLNRVPGVAAAVTTAAGLAGLTAMWTLQNLHHGTALILGVVIGASLAVSQLRLLRPQRMILSSRTATAAVRAVAGFGAVVVLGLAGLLLLDRPVGPDRVAVRTIVVGLLIAAASLAVCAGSSRHAAWWPASTIIWLIVVSMIAAVARDAHVIHPAADRRNLILALTALGVFVLILITIGPDPTARRSAMLRNFFLFRLIFGISCLGIGASWLLSARVSPIPIALLLLGGFILAHVALIQAYLRWSRGGSSDLPADRAGEFRLLGIRESAVLSISTPGVILGLIGALGKGAAGPALHVAAYALVTAISLGLVLHGLVAVGLPSTVRARMLVSYIQTFNLWSLAFGLICVALSLSFPGGKSP